VPCPCQRFAFWIAAKKAPELFRSGARPSQFYLAMFRKLHEFATNHSCQSKDAGTQQGQRAACVPGVAGGAWHVSLAKPPGTLDRAADTDMRDRTGAGSLRVPEDPRALAPGGLAGGQVSTVPVVAGRGVGAEDAAQRKRKPSRATRQSIRTPMIRIERTE